MGLGAEVGLLADLRENDGEGYEDYLVQFTAINQALSAEGLPEDHEPTDLQGRQPWFCSIGSYGIIHLLRRLAVHLWAGRGLPDPDLPKSYFAPLMDDCYSQPLDEGSPFASPHLIVHSNCDGYYLPVAFDEVIYPDESLGIAGCMIGSSHALLKECQAIATVLELPLDDSLIWEGEAEWYPSDEVEDKPAVWQRYPEEARLCWLLHNASLASIKTGCAICFT